MPVSDPENRNNICQFEALHWYRVRVTHDRIQRQTTISIWDETRGQRQPDTYAYSDVGYFPGGEGVTTIKPPKPDPVESWQFTWFTFGGNFFGHEGL